MPDGDRPRFPRLARRYQAIAYRLSLLNAGVVLQSLYLTATDLGLNGCAAGSGNSALVRAVRRRVGLDPDDDGRDPATPQGIGNIEGAAVIEARRDDGFNQFGDAGGRHITASRSRTPPATGR